MRMRKLRGPNMKMSMPFEPFRTHTQPVNLSDLEARFDAGAEVTPETLRAAGLAKRKHPVKVLGRGEISKKLTVRAHAFSAAAKEKIEAAGGTAEVIETHRLRRRPSSRDSCSRRSRTPSRSRRSAAKIVFTLAMLALYRLGAYIPAPGIDIDTVDSIEDNFTGNNVLGFLNLFSGGSRCSGCRCSRSGSCPTSPPRSSSSC